MYWWGRKVLIRYHWLTRVLLVTSMSISCMGQSMIVIIICLEYWTFSQLQKRSSLLTIYTMTQYHRYLHHQSTIAFSTPWPSLVRLRGRELGRGSWIWADPVCWGCGHYKMGWQQAGGCTWKAWHRYQGHQLQSLLRGCSGMYVCNNSIIVCLDITCVYI